jgi:hypothetical protein
MAAAHGIVDSGLLWYLTSSKAMWQFGLSCSSLDSCTWTLKEGNNVCLIVLVQTDNYLYTGLSGHSTRFEQFMSQKLKVGSKLAVLKMIILRFMVCQLWRAMEAFSSTRTARRFISSCIHSRFFTIELVILLHRSGNIDLQCLQSGSCCLLSGLFALLCFIQPLISLRSSSLLE